MTRQNKLLKRFLTKPIKKDLTYQELKRLLEGLGYREDDGEGSRVSFYHPQTGDVIDLHKPHPGNELKIYQVKMIQNKIHEILLTVDRL